ncbi:MAG: helix-turn-helix domain-containing protein [Methylococcales bacterium]
MSTLGERVAYVLEHYEGNQAGLAREVGITRSAVGQWKKGTIKHIRPENLFPLAKETGFSAKWIGTGIGNEKADSPLNENELHLIDCYRKAANKLKKTIMEVAELAS